MVSDIGERVRGARKRQGLTQHELAAAAGVSVSLVRKLEQGDYDNGLRLETAHRLAVALGVTTSALVAGSAEAEATEAEPGGGLAWEPVARAVRGEHESEPDEKPGIGGLRDALSDAAEVFLGKRFAELCGLLPLLLRDADALVSASASRDQARARQVRSEVRQLAASMLAQVSVLGPAAEAIDLAAADAADDLTAVAAADGKIFVLMRQGKLAECAAVATEHAGRCEPTITAGPDELASWGRLMSWAACVAARDNRPGDARDALRLARMAAAGVGRDVAPVLPWMMFGPITVAITSAEVAAVQDRPDVVLVIGSQVAGRAHPVPALLQRHRLDVAHAHVQMRQYAEAVGVLAQVRQAAPEWVTRQRYARDILSAVITHARRLTSEARDLADFMHLPL
jgi:transcriptional regulator with XRE-family HTH domain